MRVDVHRLRTFEAVAREGSITRAAGQLHLSEPAISLQLRELQEALDLRLFQRVTRGLELTSDGRELLPSVQEALRAMEAVERRALALRKSVGGELRIGTNLDSEYLRIGAILKTLIERYPHLRTTTQYANSSDVLRDVEARRLDAGFYVGVPDPGRFFSEVLTSLKYVVTAPPGWETRVESRGWKQLAELPWLWAPINTAYDRMLTSVFRAAGAHPLAITQIDSEPVMLDMVRSGIGLALVRETVASTEARRNKLVIVRGLSMESVLSFITLKDRAREAAVAAVIEASKAAWSRSVSATRGSSKEVAT